MGARGKEGTLEDPKASGSGITPEELGQQVDRG